MNHNFSLATLLHNLINKAPKNPNPMPQEEGKKGTTIRFEPETRRFIEEQAEHLGMSVQEFVSMVFKAIMVSSLEPQSTQLDLMTDRFFKVFTTHNVAIADIPELIPSIKRSEILSRKELINKLDDETIRNASNLFGVDPGWLKGLNENPLKTPVSRWYKNVAGVARKLAILNHEYRRIRVMFVAKNDLTLEKLAEAKAKEDSVEAIEVGLVIEKEKTIGSVSYRSFEVFESERWNYWRCRYCLKAIMKFCQICRVDYDGVLLEEEVFKNLFDGSKMPIECLDRYSIWHADQLFWSDDRNLELDELTDIDQFYKESNAAEFEEVILKPFMVVDWDAFKRGHYEIAYGKTDK